MSENANRKSGRNFNEFLKSEKSSERANERSGIQKSEHMSEWRAASGINFIVSRSEVLRPGLRYHKKHSST